MITRKQYMNNEATHAEYYGQFDCPELRNAIEGSIGLKRLLKSEDEHLNDIPLHQWDGFSFAFKRSPAARQITEANGYTKPGLCYSLSDVVCVTKAIARRMIQEIQENRP
jgi:hypothetical protein